MGTTEKEEE